MSTTLARKIRRIGRAKTTFTISIDHILVKDEQGQITERTITKTIPTRNRISYTLDDLTAKRSETVAAWRERRKKK